MTEVERQQQRVTEFLRLLPLTLELAGLPKAEAGRYLTAEQIELRANVVKTAYRAARQLVLEVANQG
jgi:hypothetical protein